MRWNVYEGKVVDIHLNRHNKLTIRVENGEKFFGYYEPRFIFLTKEEAENATCVYEPDRPQADNMVYHISNIRLDNLLNELVGEDNA